MPGVIDRIDILEKKVNSLLSLSFNQVEREQILADCFDLHKALELEVEYDFTSRKLEEEITIEDVQGYFAECDDVILTMLDGCLNSLASIATALAIFESEVDLDEEARSVVFKHLEESAYYLRQAREDIGVLEEEVLAMEEELEVVHSAEEDLSSS